MGEWSQKTICDLYRLRARIGWQGLKAHEFLDDGPYLITGTNFHDGKISWDECYHISESRYNQDTGIQIHENDLLITKDGTIGKTAVATNCPPQAALNSGVFVLHQLNRELDSKYLYYVLNSHVFELFMRNILTGSTIKHLNQEHFYKFSFTYPKQKAEQEKIAQILATVDEVIGKTKAIIEKYKAIKEGLMQDLLVNGIDENGVIRSPKTHKYKDSPLGKIPVEWECVPFETVIEKLYDYRGRTPKKLGMEWGGDIPALSASNVCMGEIDFNKQTNFGSEKLYRKWMSQGDIHKDYIAFTMEAPLGNVALVPEERKYILSQRTIVFNCKQDICKNRYLYYYLASDSFQSYLQKYNSGTTAKGIQRKQLYKMFIVYPSKTREQEDIYRALEHIDSCLANAKKHLIKHQAIKTGLMQDLLTHKVSVDPLLERSVENE